MRLPTRFLVALLPLAAITASLFAEDKASPEYPLSVMDPLALPLSCPCVKGYAQRDYEKLATFLTAELGRPVKVTFHESLVAALKKKTDGKADIVVGKHSVVLADAKKASITLTPILSLTGKDGHTQMKGLFVVPSGDPAQRVSDLKDYRIIFGPAECDEKHSRSEEQT